MFTSRSNLFFSVCFGVAGLVQSSQLPDARATERLTLNKVTNMTRCHSLKLPVLSSQL